MDLLQVAQQALLIVLPLLNKEEALGILTAGQLQRDVQVVGEQIGEVLQRSLDLLCSDSLLENKDHQLVVNLPLEFLLNHDAPFSIPRSSFDFLFQNIKSF